MQTPVSKKIRPVVPNDLPQLKSVIDSNELFPSEMLDEMISGFFDNSEDCIWLTTTTADDTANSIAYCAPEKMT